MAHKVFVGSLSFSTTSEGLREFFSQAGTALSATVVTDQFSGRSSSPSRRRRSGAAPRAAAGGEAGVNPPLVTLFLAGDVMVGRGIDQVLSRPSQPCIHEPFAESALDYVSLAEARSGRIPKPVDDAYVWGDALTEFDREVPDARIINLETSITTSEDYWPDKGIHYRMHPDNVACLTAARIDCCVLANNHVLDWGYAGLAETVAILRRAGVRTAGAGRDAAEAAAPAIIALGEQRRVAVFGLGVVTSGIPQAWRASAAKPGVNLLRDLSTETVREITRQVQDVKQPGTIVVASVHWGQNWGFEIPSPQRLLAHRLIDEAGVDVVHGHSSHHPKAIEVYRGRLVLYGCGDLLNDYEGIDGDEGFLRDLGLMYFASLDLRTGALVRLHMTPTKVARLRVRRASSQEARQLHEMLNREGEQFGTRVRLEVDHTLTLEGGSA
jgi:poly-gamma-glutamate synthesis protein (capsule biosynthesis protein)